MLSQQEKQEKMERLIRKMIEVETDEIQEKVPETGTFRKVFVIFQLPGGQFSGLLSVEPDYKQTELRRVVAGVFRNGNDRLVSNYLYTGAKQEVLDWLREEERVQELIEICEHLREKVEDLD